MDKERKKELKEAYARRCPERGIVCWKSGERMWIAKSKDAAADFNSTSFQLKLGSWPNREMQSAYRDAPESFQWSLLKKLEYEDPADDCSEDLELLYIETLEEYPEARAMKPGKR